MCDRVSLSWSIGRGRQESHRRPGERPGDTVRRALTLRGTPSVAPVSVVFPCAVKVDDLPGTLDETQGKLIFQRVAPVCLGAADQLSFSGRRRSAGVDVAGAGRGKGRSCFTSGSGSGQLLTGTLSGGNASLPRPAPVSRCRLRCGLRKRWVTTLSIGRWPAPIGTSPAVNLFTSSGHPTPDPGPGPGRLSGPVHGA